MTAIDLFVMVQLASWVRTEKQWRDLAHAAGLEVTRVWTFHPDCDSIVEMELQR